MTSVPGLRCWCDCPFVQQILSALRSGKPGRFPADVWTWFGVQHLRKSCVLEVKRASSVSGQQSRGRVHQLPEMSPPAADACTEEASDDDRCSYEKERDKRVAKMKELMLPLVQTSKSL